MGKEQVLKAERADMLTCGEEIRIPKFTLIGTITEIRYDFPNFETTVFIAPSSPIIQIGEKRFWITKLSLMSRD